MNLCGGSGGTGGMGVIKGEGWMKAGRARRFQVGEEKGAMYAQRHRKRKPMYSISIHCVRYNPSGIASAAKFKAKPPIIRLRFLW